MGNKDTGGRVEDVDRYLKDISRLIKQYRSLVEKLTVMAKNKKKNAAAIPDLLLERKHLQENFIAKKQAARANVALLKDGMDALKDRELRDLQEEYRECDGEFKALGLMVEQESLFEGAAKREAGREKFDPSRAKNDDLLDKAASTQRSNLEKLKAGLATVESTKETGKQTAAQLEEDREKIKRIDSGLDEVQSELQLSAVYITRFAKRLMTDKIIIAFAFLLVLGVAGVIAYSALNPGQTTFNVPSDLVPCISTAIYQCSVTATLSPSPSPTVAAAGRLLLRGR